MRVGRFLATLNLMKTLQPDEHLAPQEFNPCFLTMQVIRWTKFFKIELFRLFYSFFFFLLKLKATPNSAGVYARMFKS